MEWKLSPEEARILGALMEKQMATPDYYPLTLNALVQACNQKSSRFPVVSYDESLVKDHLNSLYNRALVNFVTARDRRAVRYDQRLSKLLHCSEQETAVLCVLLLRGAQTPGEIKGRTNRLYEFESLLEVQETLDGMLNREELPLIHRLQREPGRKEHRFQHNLGEEKDISETEREPKMTNAVEQSTLREEIDEIKRELHILTKAFEEFKQQFM
ncbi:MAG: hypothetical protein CSA81_05590 [Acidobacteria bacterium]|nr:MAG: hypothetical protein CSA81_05590 [Acidobacteriota bacterium]PIE90938.1 MAG: hypothetical protein CR997_03520 [Acidobacteriota bacterium]